LLCYRVAVNVQWRPSRAILIVTDENQLHARRLGLYWLTLQ